jgi:hypothetical protein
MMPTPSPLRWPAPADPGQEVRVVQQLRTTSAVCSISIMRAQW